MSWALTRPRLQEKSYHRSCGSCGEYVISFKRREFRIFLVNSLPHCGFPLDRLKRQNFAGKLRNFRMKPLPAPDVPGKTELERFENGMRQILSVSKEELAKREEEWKQGRTQRKKTRPNCP